MAVPIPHNFVRKPLPIPPPYNEILMSVTKVHMLMFLYIYPVLNQFNCMIIVGECDELHFRNHTDMVCREKYNPSTIKEKHPGVSFMSAEQIFAWLSRFHTILSAMPKTHHLFYLHRLVEKRNAYTELLPAE